MKAYSQDLRDRAINMYNSGIKRKEISKLLSIHYETIRLWIRMYLDSGDYSSKQHLNTGRPCTFTDKEGILNYLDKNPNALAAEIRDDMASDMPISTFRDTLYRMNITYKKRNLLPTKR
jgi:transposase